MTPRRTASARTWSFMRTHKALTAVAMATLVVSAAVLASVLINQSVSTSPTTKAPDVVFLTGDDLVSIEALGFLDATIGASATSVTLTIYGIAGATDVTMTDVLELDNTHLTTDYTVTLVRSAALDASINLFEITLRGVALGDVTWDVKGDADGRSPSFTLQDDGTAGDLLEIDIAIGIADGVATGANLSDFDLTFELVPV